MHTALLRCGHLAHPASPAETRLPGASSGLGAPGDAISISALVKGTPELSALQAHSKKEGHHAQARGCGGVDVVASEPPVCRRCWGHGTWSYQQFHSWWYWRRGQLKVVMWCDPEDWVLVPAPAFSLLPGCRGHSSQLSLATGHWPLPCASQPADPAPGSGAC